MTAPGARPTRVAIVAPSLRGGGLERMVRDLALGLHARGFAPAVFCITGLGIYAEDLQRAGIPAVDCREGRWRVRGVPLKLIRALRAFAPDVLHAHSGTWLPSAIAATVLRRPLVFTDHGRYYPEPTSRAVVERWCHARTARMVAVTGALAEYVEGFLRVPAPLVIANGIDLDAYRLDDPTVRPRLRAEWGLDASDVVVTAVGRFAPVKNHLGLVESFADALRDAPSLVLALVGTGALQAETAARAAALGVADRVRFLGYRTDVRDCLHASECFVNASSTEALPISLIEAMAVGLPSVATAVGGVPDALGDPPAGLLVPAGDRAALAGALARIGRDAPLRAELARLAARRSRDFSLGAMADGYARTYLDALGAARGARGAGASPPRAHAR